MTHLMNNKKTPIGTIMKRAWSSLDGKIVTIGIISELYYFSKIGCALLSGIGIGIIADYILLPVLLLGANMCALKLVRGKALQVVDLWDGYGHVFNAMSLNFVNSLLIYLWSLLFIIPGIIKSYEYSMSFYVLADNPKLSHSEAREESKRLMEGNILRAIALDLIMQVFNAVNIVIAVLMYKAGGWELMLTLGFVTIALLGFVVIPYTKALTAVFYEVVKEEKAPPVYVPIEE